MHAHGKAVEAEVTQMAADFLKIEGREAALILAFLARRPAEWSETLWRAEWEAKIESPIRSYGSDIDPDVMVHRERRRVNAWLKLARFGWCGTCFGASVLYPNGVELSWPYLDHHVCDPQQRTVDQVKARILSEMRGRGVA